MASSAAAALIGENNRPGDNTHKLMSAARVRIWSQQGKAHLGEQVGALILRRPFGVSVLPGIRAFSVRSKVPGSLRQGLACLRAGIRASDRWEIGRIKPNVWPRLLNRLLVDREKDKEQTKSGKEQAAQDLPERRGDGRGGGRSERGGSECGGSKRRRGPVRWKWNEAHREYPPRIGLGRRRGTGHGHSIDRGPRTAGCDRSIDALTPGRWLPVPLVCEELLQVV